MFEILDGTLLDIGLSEKFELLHLGNIEKYFGNINPPAFMHEESNCHLTDMLFCHETLQDDDVHLPLGPAQSTLVLPAWLREKADTLTGADWARLCELGVAAATQHVGEGEREGMCEECEMPMLELSAAHEGFVW